MSLEQKKVVGIEPFPASGFTPQLTGEDKDRAEGIALGDERVAAILNGKTYNVVGISPAGYQNEAAGVEIRLPEPAWVQYDWPYYVPDYSDVGFKGFYELVWRHTLHLSRLYLTVDLKEGKVTMIDSRGSGDEDVKAAEVETTRTKDLALADPRVQDLLLGEEYHVSGAPGLWYSKAPPVIHTVLDIRFQMHDMRFQPREPGEHEWVYEEAGKEVSRRLKLAGVYGVYVEVDLQSDKIISILPYFYD